MSIAQVIAGKDHPIINCSPDDDVRHAAGLLAGKKIGALPVMEGDEVVGIFSERDVLYCIAELGADALDKKVREVMTAPAITITPEERALDALSLMTRRRIRHLPVIDNGKLAAFVSIGDIVKYRVEKIEAEAEQMREYIATA